MRNTIRLKEASTMQRFNAARAAYFAMLVAVAFAALAVSAAQAHDPAIELGARGTAVVDGVEGPGEWDRADKWDFTVNVPGGGSTPATLYAMNDDANVYLALKHGRPELAAGINIAFDNDHDGGALEEGDDVLIVNRFGFHDMFVSRQPPCPPTYTCIGIRDTEVGGTSEGSGILRQTGPHAFLELSHPLDTADNAHDFSLRFGKRAGFRLIVFMCGQDCATTSSPSGGDVVIVSGSTIAPETQITGGPADGSFLDEETAELTFAGTDDAIAAEDLRFECSQNGDEFEVCESPWEYVPERQGSQSFAVRAIDEVGNVDSTPAVRRWTLDTLWPKRPLIRGPRLFHRARVVYRLSAKDNVDRPKQLRFRCSLDRGVFRPCSARLALRVRPGRHVLLVVAIDRTGNVSDRARAKFVRLTAR
jgi:hypothetical protein